MEEIFENVSILLCEDDENLGMLLREYLEAQGFKAELCADGEEKKVVKRLVEAVTTSASST